MKRRSLREWATGKLLDLMAYKFEINYQSSLVLDGIDGGPSRVARDVSRVVADSYNGRSIAESDTERLEDSLYNARLI